MMRQKIETYNKMIKNTMDLLEQLIEKINALEDKVTNLQAEIKDLQESKKEKYYQTFLEKHFKASHKVTKYGITDISTDTHHIEIKQWGLYKQAFGQLKCYNHKDKKQLIVAFFGNYKDKDKILELFHSNKIEVWDLQETPNGIIINKYPIEQENNDFYNWLSQNIQLSAKETDYIELKTMCELYLNKTNLPSKISTKYKKEIEKYIKENYKTIKWEYDQIYVNSTRYRGWQFIKFN
jgi:uncharacterized protein (UPF0335 family)